MCSSHLSPGSGTGAVGKEQRKEIWSQEVPGLRGIRGARRPAFLFPSPKGCMPILTDPPLERVTLIWGRGGFAGAPLPASLHPSAGEQLAASPRPVPFSGGQMSSGSFRTHPVAWDPGPSLQRGAPPGVGRWEKLASLRVQPVSHGSSRRQFVHLSQRKVLPGTRSCVPHCPSNRCSVTQTNN